MTADLERDELSVSERVIRAVAAERDADLTDLEPLYHSLDPECLDELFPADAASESRDRQLTFPYEDHVVTVSGDGRVEVFAEDGRMPDLSSAGSTASSPPGNPGSPD